MKSLHPENIDNIYGVEIEEIIEPELKSE